MFRNNKAAIAITGIAALGTALGTTLVTGLVLAQSASQPALYVTAAAIADGLTRSAGERPGMAVGTVSTTDDYRINMIQRTAAAGAIVHEAGTELHYITSGAGTLVTGGSVLRPADGGRATIENGVAQQVTVGDAILIPEGTPHMYSDVEGAITYLEVRFNIQ